MLNVRFQNLNVSFYFRSWTRKYKCNVRTLTRYRTNTRNNSYKRSITFESDNEMWVICTTIFFYTKLLAVVKICVLKKISFCMHKVFCLDFSFQKQCFLTCLQKCICFLFCWFGTCSSFSLGRRLCGIRGCIWVFL